MCMMLYLASDSPLPEIEWDERNPAFHVTSQLHPKAVAVRESFTKAHVYYVGSDQKCGCGFGYCTDDEYRSDYRNHPDLIEKALEENERGRENVRRLREYLEAALESGPVDLYAVQAGSEGIEPEKRLQVGPAYFGGDTFVFGRGQFITVRKDLTSLGL